MMFWLGLLLGSLLGLYAWNLERIQKNVALHWKAKWLLKAREFLLDRAIAETKKDIYEMILYDLYKKNSQAIDSLELTPELKELINNMIKKIDEA